MGLEKIKKTFPPKFQKYFLFKILLVQKKEEARRMNYTILSTSFYSAKQFILFRLLFGSYLIWHFYSLIGYGQELFGQNGMILQGKRSKKEEEEQKQGSYSSYLSLNIFTWTENPDYILFLLVLLSIGFTFGIKRRTCSFLLYYAWVCLFISNPLISNPSLAYIGWLLVVCVLIPSTPAEYNSVIKPYSVWKEWQIPPFLYWGSWILMNLGYTISGVHKLLTCESWRDGSALSHVLTSPLARSSNSWILSFLLFTCPPLVLQLLTWFALFLESSAFPLGLFYYTRKWYWLLFVGMHFGILFVVNFTDLTLGVLMIHLFTFDARWITKKKLD